MSTDSDARVSSDSSVVNAATLIMAISGAGKSSLLATAAEYVWDTARMQSLYYLTDGGGFPVQMQALINQGIVRLWRMRTRSGQGLTHETCQRAAQGWWPATINPRTGETPPNVRLVPPTTEYFVLQCPEGHPVRRGPSSALVLDREVACPTCAIRVSAANGTVVREVQRTRGFEQVGACFYDGLTSMLSWGMEDLTERTGRQELTGEKSALGGIIQSGDLNLAGSNRAQVGFMQKRAESLVLASNAIPGLVIPPIWTALTQEGTDEGGLLIRGPQIMGQAVTAIAPQWFGDSMEAVVVETADGKKYRRLYLQQFVDKNGVRHLCRVRSYPGYLPLYLEDEDSNDPNAPPPFQQFSLAHFYRLRDAARVKAEQMYAERFADAPGLPPEGIVTVGEPATVSTLGAAGTTPAAGPTGARPTQAQPIARPKARPAAPAAPAAPVVPATLPTTPMPPPGDVPAETPVAAAPATLTTTAPHVVLGAPGTPRPLAQPTPKLPARGPVPPPGRPPTR